MEKGTKIKVSVASKGLLPRDSFEYDERKLADAYCQSLAETLVSFFEEEEVTAEVTWRPGEGNTEINLGDSGCDADVDLVQRFAEEVWGDIDWDAFLIEDDTNVRKLIEKELKRLHVDCDALGPVDGICCSDVEDDIVDLYDDNACLSLRASEALKLLRSLPDNAGWDTVWDTLIN